LKVMVCTKVDGHKRHPDDAGTVHGERDVLGLVKVLWNLARLERVDGAQNDEEDVVQQRHDGGDLASSAPEHQLAFLVVGQHHRRLLEAQPGERADHLYSRKHIKVKVKKRSNPVCLGQDGGVDEAERDAQGEAPDEAGEHARPGQHGHRRDVGDGDTEQQDVAQLPARRHDHRRFVEDQEHTECEDGAQH
ncbi:hypothetical protein EGW08_006679, partial [Elysia chlorotica]